MSIELAIALMVAIVVLYAQRSKDPLCEWCTRKHKGRCMWNPRSGKILANINDGFYDHENPNA